MKIRNWPIFIFVVLYHIAIIALIPTAIAVFSWGAFWFFLVTYIIGGFLLPLATTAYFLIKRTMRTLFMNGVF